ncbi:hypothetical protein OA50_05671 [Mameliella alba]|uniref:Uncharacterized protein n=1 Tax=Mameliella alba TaxID=561184 RepID=A0A0B3REW2_9RHOB|nr:hypothetical protein OA50_05671 [Mameliella alba]
MGAQHVLAVLAVVQHHFRRDRDRAAGARDQQVEPPVVKGHVDHARRAHQCQRLRGQHRAMARHPVLHQRVAEGGRAGMHPAEPQPPARAVDVAALGAVDRRAVMAGQGHQRMGQLVRIPDIVLVGDRHMGGGQLGVADQRQEIRRRPPARPLDQADLVAGGFASEPLDDPARAIGRSVVRDPERPAGVILRPEALQLRGQVRRALVAGQQDGDRGETGGRTGRRIGRRIGGRGRGHHGTRSWCAPF